MKKNETYLMEVKERYETPSLWMIWFDTEDVIQTSGFSGEDDPL